MLSKKMKIILISVGGALVVGGGLGVGLGLGLRHEDPPEPKPIEYDVDPCPEGTHVDSNLDGFCDVCNYPVEMQHGTSVTGDPSAPFYLKIGEEKQIKATISPSPKNDNEKKFAWTVNKKTVGAFVTEGVSSNINKVIGIASGEDNNPAQVVFTATNTYNPSLKRDFHANVIYYDEDNMYLWEYVSADRAKFGYVNEVGQKAGVTDGVATLGALDWTFHRSATNSLQSNKGGIGFGKGNKPETLVKLTAHNERQVKRIVIETASARSLANITVKIGDNEVINKKTPSFSDDFIGSVTYRDLEDAPNKYTGDISIQFDTPDYDPVEADLHPESYQAPGAVYLKSIWIEYYEYELDWKTNKIYDLESKYLNMETDPDFNVLTGSEKEITINDEENGIQIKFNKLKKPASDSKIQGFALTNGDIEIISTKPDEVIKKVSFEFKCGNSVATYSEYTSVFGGAPYLDLMESVKGTKESVSHIGKFIKDDHVNSVLFLNDAKSTHYNVGVKSITVKTISGTQLELDKLSIPEGTVLDKTSYKVGETFSPAGILNVSATFTDTSIDPVVMPADVFTYYDAQTYDNEGKCDTYLQEGTTEVVTFLNGKELRVGPIEVILVKLNFVKVTSLDQIDVTSSYLVTCPEYKAFALGSSDSKMADKDGCLVDSKMEFGDTCFVPDLYKNDLFKFEINNSTGKYTFVNYNHEHTWGVTESLSTSCSYSKAMCKEWEITLAEEPVDEKEKESFVEGSLSITMQTVDKEGNDQTVFLYSTGSTFKTAKVTSKTSVKSNIVLYKLVTE